MMKKLMVCAVVAMLALAGVAQAECYSEGVRVGMVQKFSAKGWVNKSWEGELVMDGTKFSGNANGSRGGNVWRFSVLDAGVAQSIDDAVMNGRPVALKYCQVAFALGQTDTPYRITKAVLR